MRRFHRWLGLSSAATLFITAITGLLWAYAPFLYWEKDYLQKKCPSLSSALDGIMITHQDVIRVARKQFGDGLVISNIALHGDLGIPLYEIAGKRDGKEFTFLIEARTSKILSPITPEFATQIAQQYVQGKPPLESVTLLNKYVHRSGKVHSSVYQVRFQQEKNPEVFIDADSGKILEEQDDIRRFHFWIMQLHQLNFFGFKKTLTVIPGLALLLLVISGVVMGTRSNSRPKKSENLEFSQQLTQSTTKKWQGNASPL